MKSPVPKSDLTILLQRFPQLSVYWAICIKVVFIKITSKVLRMMLYLKVIWTLNSILTSSIFSKLLTYRLTRTIVGPSKKKVLEWPEKITIGHIKNDVQTFSIQCYLCSLWELCNCSEFQYSLPRYFSGNTVIVAKQMLYSHYLWWNISNITTERFFAGWG